MNRQEFMARLNQLLEGIPEEEKREALAYYTGYFEDAGVENEEEIIRELGSPEKVAKTIRMDFGVETSKEKDNTAAIVSVVLLSPIWGSLLLAVICCLLAAVCAVGAVVIAGVIGGGAVVVVGVMSLLMRTVGVGILCIGIGLLMIALGILAMIPMVLLCAKGIPETVRGTIRLVKKLF